MKFRTSSKEILHYLVSCCGVFMIMCFPLYLASRDGLPVLFVKLFGVLAGSIFLVVVFVGGLRRGLYTLEIKGDGVIHERWGFGGRVINLNDFDRVAMIVPVARYGNPRINLLNNDSRSSACLGKYLSLSDLEEIIKFLAHVEFVNQGHYYPYRENRGGEVAA